MRVILEVTLAEGEETTLEEIATAIREGLQAYGLRLKGGGMASNCIYSVSRCPDDALTERHQRHRAEVQAKTTVLALTKGLRPPKTRLDYIMLTLDGKAPNRATRSKWKPGKKPNEDRFLRLALEMGKHVGNGFGEQALSVLTQIRSEFSRSYGWQQISYFLGMGRCGAMIEHYLTDATEKADALAIHQACIVANTGLQDMELHLPFADDETYNGFYLANLEGHSKLSRKWRL